jgi:hypothetical protein
MNFDKKMNLCHNRAIMKEVSRMKSNARILSILLAAVVLLAACTPAAAPTQQANPTVDVNPIYTAAAKTIEVESTRKAALIPTNTPEPTEVPTETPTATLEPTLPPSGTVYPTPTMWIPVSGDTHPSISAIYDTNCRQGPDENFDVVGGLRVGETSKVIGMLPYGAWWYIENPGKTDPKYCWVWGETTKVEGATDSVPEMSAPATPYVHLPKITVSMSADPATSTTCPVKVTFTGTIKTSAEGNFTYSIYDDEGTVFDSGLITFKDDGSDSVSVTKTFKETYSGWVQMKVTNPVGQKSNKAYIEINCD